MLEHLLSLLRQLSWNRTGQVKILVIKKSFLLVMIIEDCNMEEVVEEEGDVLFFGLSVTSSVKKAEMRSQH